MLSNDGDFSTDSTKTGISHDGQTISDLPKSIFACLSAPGGEHTVQTMACTFGSRTHVFNGRQRYLGITYPGYFEGGYV